MAGWHPEDLHTAFVDDGRHMCDTDIYVLWYPDASQIICSLLTMGHILCCPLCSEQMPL